MIQKQQSNVQAIQNSILLNCPQLIRQLYKSQDLKSSNLSYPEDNLQPIIYPFVGIIRANWKSKDGNLISINYGTATYLSKRIVLTCIHNIYSERYSRICNQFFFIPGVESGSIDQKRVYKSKNQESFYRGQIPNKPLGIEPLSEELCLVILEKQIQLPTTIQFPKIGTLSEYSLNPSLKLRLIGYPSVDYYSHTNLRDIEVNREDLSGHFYGLKNHILKYTMKTKFGQSGSPILAKNIKGQQIIIGIHTHRGLQNHYNSGLFFTPQILNKLYSYLKQIKEEIYPFQAIQQKQNNIPNDLNEDSLFEVESQDEEYLNNSIMSNILLQDSDCSSQVSQCQSHRSTITLFDDFLQARLPQNYSTRQPYSNQQTYYQKYDTYDEQQIQINTNS